MEPQVCSEPHPHPRQETSSGLSVKPAHLQCSLPAGRSRQLLGAEPSPGGSSRAQGRAEMLGGGEEGRSQQKGNSGCGFRADELISVLVSAALAPGPEL